MGRQKLVLAADECFRQLKHHDLLSGHAQRRPLGTTFEPVTVPFLAYSSNGSVRFVFSEYTRNISSYGMSGVISRTGRLFCPPSSMVISLKIISIAFIFPFLASATRACEIRRKFDVLCPRAVFLSAAASCQATVSRQHVRLG
jgi:hypothetical protein